MTWYITGEYENGEIGNIIIPEAFECTALDRAHTEHGLVVAVADPFEFPTIRDLECVKNCDQCTHACIIVGIEPMDDGWDCEVDDQIPDGTDIREDEPCPWFEPRTVEEWRDLTEGPDSCYEDD